MLHGTYDNRVTDHREWWQHGTLIASISREHMERVSLARKFTGPPWGSYANPPENVWTEELEAELLELLRK